MSWLEVFHAESRWALLLLVLVPLVWWWAYARRRPTAVRFSSTQALASVRPSWRVRLWWLIPLLRTLALILLIVALARPRKGNEQARIPAEGIAIQLIVDRSSSMEALDFQLEGQRVNRLAAVRNVVEGFVSGGEGLRGRPDDLIGMISFARYADDKCPLTLDHGYLIDVLEQTEIVTRQEEDGTAIGDAIGLGVERLRAIDDQQRRSGGKKIKSKVIVLLTDGENNAGDLDPVRAAELAATFDIKIYTIGAGTTGYAPFPTVDPFTGRRVLRNVEVTIDEETLRRIADATGGEYYRATDTDSLRRVYAEIDKLEKTRTVELRYYQYTELATQSIRLGSLHLPPVLLCAFALVALEVVLAQTLLRRAP